MNTILTIVGMASVMNLIHKHPLYWRVLEKLKLNLKPFSCIMCSTFWFTVGFTAFTTPMECIFISSSAAILAELINIQVHKI